MTLNDPLANVLSHINNYEKTGNKELLTDNNSKLIRQVLDLMQEKGMIAGYEEVEDGKGKKLKVKLSGFLNDAGVIKPRFTVKVSHYEKFEHRYLPAKDFGLIVVSTSQGLMSHAQAKEKNLGGTLISYAY